MTEKQTTLSLNKPSIKISGGDLIIIMFAILCTVWLYWQYGSNNSALASQAKIIAQGKEFTVVSLYENRIINVPGPQGITVVEVRDGAVRCKISPGTQHICERAGWLRHGGERAVSIPNRVMIQVLGDNPRYDSISY
jgi:hypothetical protein